jgi:HEAT repeat protein
VPLVLAAALVALYAGAPDRAGRARDADALAPAPPEDLPADDGPVADGTRAEPQDLVDEAILLADTPEDLPDLFRLLDAAPPRRDRVIRRIARVGGDAAWEGLVARLGDPQLRLWIEPALGRFAPAEVLAELKRRFLASPDPEARASLLRILGFTEDARHGDDVRGTLAREADPGARHAAIGALGRFGDPASADALLAVARRGGPEARAARLALGERPQAETLEGLAARWTELDAETRLAVLLAGRDVERPGAALEAAARRSLRDPDPRLRAQAADLLARAGAVEPLRDFAFDAPTRAELEHALRALVAVGTPAAAEAGLRVVDARAERLGAAASRHREALLGIAAAPR